MVFVRSFAKASISQTQSVEKFSLENQMEAEKLNLNCSSSATQNKFSKFYNQTLIALQIGKSDEVSAHATTGAMARYRRLLIKTAFSPPTLKN